MELFARKTPSLLGLDIGSSAVKLVELSRRRGNYCVEACAIEPLPANAVEERNISDAAAVGEAVRAAWRRARARRRTAAVAVANSAVMLQTLVVDATLADADLEVEVALEAERSIPYAIDDVALDFVPLGPVPDDAALNRVLLAACPREYVEWRETAVAHGGLKAVAVDVETYARRRAAGRLLADAKDTAAIVDIGASTVGLSVLARDQAAFAREEPFDPALRQDGEAFGDESLRLAARLLDGYAVARPAGRIDRVLLADSMSTTAGLLNLPNLPALASARLGVSAELANPFVGMAVGRRVDAALLARNAPALMTACGLAMGAWR